MAQNPFLDYFTRVNEAVIQTRKDLIASGTIDPNINSYDLFAWLRPPSVVEPSRPPPPPPAGQPPPPPPSGGGGGSPPASSQTQPPPPPVTPSVTDFNGFEVSQS